MTIWKGDWMFYRYEAENKETGEYEGIFSFFNPSERRYFNRFLKEPKWYEKHPNVESKCWFTQDGYDKYHHIIDEIIASYQPWPSRRLNIRLLTKSTLENIACKGKMQCIEVIKE